MATTIKLKNGSGAPLAGDLVQGEPAFDLTNKRLYTENASGTIIEVGTSPSTIDINAGTIDGTVIGGSSAAAGTFTTFTSTGIDDNATSTAITIDSSENVGIGTTSPSYQLDVEFGGDGMGLNSVSNTTFVEFYETGARKADVTYRHSDATARSDILEMRTVSGDIAFRTVETERMRINSGGSVLIGKDVRDSTTVGTYFDPTYGGVIVRDGANPLLLNRLSSDGDLVLFRKDGTTVGSIGTQSGEITLDKSGGSGLFISDLGTFPRFNGALSDNTQNLGGQNYRWKDLYLSGGAYVGGTAAANHLDDYEEGTWTPSVSGGAISGTSLSYAGTYTKIGRLVYIYFEVSSASSDVNIASYASISGLPFTLTYPATGTAITEDINVFDRQGFAIATGTVLQISNAGSSSGTTGIRLGIVGTTS